MNHGRTAGPFALYIVHHPQSELGDRIASAILDHFGSERFRQAAGGFSLPVTFRNQPAPNSETPLPINWEEADATAAVILADQPLIKSEGWSGYAKALEQQADNTGFNIRTFFVTLSEEALTLEIQTQAMRWDQWHGTDQDKIERLTRELTCDFPRMLRVILNNQQQAGNSDMALEQYIKDIPVFLSHSKHDAYGENIANAIRSWLNQNAFLTGFLDVKDTVSGVSYNQVFKYKMETGVTVLVYTDSYSSREFCRQEVLMAKQMLTPIILVDCLKRGDERSFPYMGNIPSIRADPESIGNYESIHGGIADEIFKNLLWKCHIRNIQSEHPRTAFIPGPPELLSLVNLKKGLDTDPIEVVYPGNPLGAAELELLKRSDPALRILSLNQWLAEQGI